MQTFLPFPDLRRSAESLDRLRLGKQRVEVLQLVRALRSPNREPTGWANHPAARMWCGHAAALAEYGLAICREWVVERGYRDTCAAKIRALVEPSWDDPPDWFGDERLHRSHRSNLLRKDPAFYGPQFTGDDAVPSDLPYWWPS